MSVITTVRGDIAPEDLGYTSVHEHLNVDSTLMRQFADEVYRKLVIDNPARILSH
jgi:predicted metal-dependent phosphotriesterase family hydrolase